MKKFAWAALSSLVFASCGSVTAGLTFKPPANWAAFPSIMGRMQMWMKDTGDKKKASVLMLIRGNQDLSLSDFTKNGQFEQIGGSGKMSDFKRDTITICGNERVEHFTATGTNRPSGTPARIEGVIAPAQGSKYLAMYIWPANLPPDPSAQGALRSVCPI